MALVLKSNKNYQGLPSQLPSNNIVEGASYIYATYLVNTSYTGPLLTAVNDSAETREFSAKSDGFLDSAEIVSFAKGGNVYVSSLKNQVGDGTSADRSDNAYRPLLAENGAAILNRFGKPSIRTSGGSGLLDRSAKAPRNPNSISIFFDVEPNIIHSSGTDVFQPRVAIPRPTSGEKVDIGLRIRVLPSNKTEFNYPNNAAAFNTISLASAELKPKLVGSVKISATDGTIKSNINGSVIESSPSDGVAKITRFTEISLASSGPQYNDFRSFNGVFNCLIMR